MRLASGSGCWWGRRSPSRACGPPRRATGVWSPDGRRPAQGVHTETPGQALQGIPGPVSEVTHPLSSSIPLVTQFSPFQSKRRLPQVASTCRPFGSSVTTSPKQSRRRTNHSAGAKGGAEPKAWAHGALRRSPECGRPSGAPVFAIRPPPVMLSSPNELLLNRQSPTQVRPPPHSLLYSSFCPQHSSLSPGDAVQS